MSEQHRAEKGQQYKTGDRHPTHNLTAFVEYDEEGHEIWTSIGGDSEAPFRLASLNAQRRAAGMRICSRIGRTGTRLDDLGSDRLRTGHQDGPQDNPRAE